MSTSIDQPGTWVLLSHRMPRDPSTPRITVWRKLKRLGVAQISHGLVALPADAGTREQIDWIAEEIVDNGGTAADRAVDALHPDRSQKDTARSGPLARESTSTESPRYRSSP